MNVTLLGIIAVSKEWQFANALDSILVTEFGILIDLSLLQELKASIPIVVILFGREMEVILELENARSPMDITS